MAEVLHLVAPRLVDELDAAEARSMERRLVRAKDELSGLYERLEQLQGSAYHVEGDGRFIDTCLLCGASWPCPGYAREVSEP